MAKEVNLLSYWMPFLRNIRELKEIAKTEEPELRYILKERDRALDNLFIATADEYGIKRFESMMGIVPEEDDSLEARRARVLTNWFSTLPYTVKMLIKKLTILCGGDDFRITKRFNEYTIIVTTHLKLYSQLLSLREILEEMIPANMVIVSNNSIIIRADGSAKIYTGLRLTGKHKKIRTEVKNYGME